VAGWAPELVRRQERREKSLPLGSINWIDMAQDWIQWKVLCFVPIHLTLALLHQ